MLQSQLVSLLLKVLGVYCLVRFVETVPNAIVMGLMFFDEPTSAAAAYVAVCLPPVALLLLAFVLIRYGDRLGARLANDEPLASVEMPDAGQWLAMALMVVGAVLIVWELPGLLTKAASALSTARAIGDGELAERARRGRMLPVIASVVKLAIGLYLVLGARGLAGLLVRARGLGPVRSGS